MERWLPLKVFSKRVEGLANDKKGVDM